MSTPLRSPQRPVGSVCRRLPGLWLARAVDCKEPPPGHRRGGPDPNGAARCCGQRPEVLARRLDSFSTATKGSGEPPGAVRRIWSGAANGVRWLAYVLVSIADWAQDNDRHRKSRAPPTSRCAQRPDDHRPPAERHRIGSNAPADLHDYTFAATAGQNT